MHAQTSKNSWILTGACLIAIGLLQQSCISLGKKKKAEPEMESATVLPSDPNSVAPGGYSSEPGSSGYQGTSEGSASSSGMQTTYSGLQYQVLKKGTGRRPSSYSRVKVHYKGTLPNGTTFDSSYQRGKPSEFGVTQVIAGWTEGLMLMQEGAKYRFIIPPELAYGPSGSPPKIGPNQTLHFDVELIEVLY